MAYSKECITRVVYDIKNELFELLDKYIEENSTLKDKNLSAETLHTLQGKINVFNFQMQELQVLDGEQKTFADFKHDYVLPGTNPDAPFYYSIIWLKNDINEDYKFDSEPAMVDENEYKECRKECYNAVKQNVDEKYFDGTELKEICKNNVPLGFQYLSEIEELEKIATLVDAEMPRPYFSWLNEEIYEPYIAKSDASLLADARARVESKRGKKTAGETDGSDSTAATDDDNILDDDLKELERLRKERIELLKEFSDFDPHSEMTTEEKEQEEKEKQEEKEEKEEFENGMDVVNALDKYEQSIDEYNQKLEELKQTQKEIDELYEDYYTKQKTNDPDASNALDRLSAAFAKGKDLFSSCLKDKEKIEKEIEKIFTEKSLELIDESLKDLTEGLFKIHPIDLTKKLDESEEETLKNDTIKQGYYNYHRLVPAREKVDKALKNKEILALQNPEFAYDDFNKYLNDKNEQKRKEEEIIVKKGGIIVENVDDFKRNLEFYNKQVEALKKIVEDINKLLEEYNKQIESDDPKAENTYNQIKNKFEEGKTLFGKIQKFKENLDKSKDQLNKKSAIEAIGKYDLHLLQIIQGYGIKKEDINTVDLSTLSDEQRNIIIKYRKVSETNIYIQNITNINIININFPWDKLDDVFKGKEPKKDELDHEKDEPVPKQDEPSTGEVLTLEAIYYKVMGTKSFTHQQERRYHASQIKIFQNPFAKNPKNAKRGNAYRVGSFLEGLTKIVFGVIAVPIRLIRKGLASLFQSHESKQIFEDIKARAMNLTDKEVEVILNEYYNTTALEFRATPIFGEAIMPRVNKYISERVTKINQRITELTMNIMLYTNAGERFRQLAADPKIDDTHRAMYNGLANLAFKKAGNCIDELLIKKNEGDILCDGKGYHALQEDIRAQQTGLNYYGGRFANNHGYEGKVFDEVSTLANIYKDKSIDPEKRAKAFLKNREYHIAHDKKKRMARNLWSKVDVGELSYRPYVEMIDYDRDPLIQQYLTAAMLAVGIASMIRNITNVIRSNRTDARNLAIDKQNQQAANNVTSQNQAASGKINGYVDEVEKARNVGVDGTQRSVDAIEQAGYQDIATGHQAREWANTVDNGFHTERASYISADDLVHGSSADATESFRAGIADINQDYAQGLANGNLDHASMVQRASEQYLGSSTVTGARQYLTDSIGQLNSVIQKQGHTGGKGYDYTALETMTRGLEQSLSVGGIDTAVSTLTEFHTTLCTLPVLSNLNLCTSLVLTPSAAAGLDLLSTAALNAGALGSAAALAGTRENTSGMSIDQGDMESLIEDMRSAGVSEDEISKAMSEISNEYTPEPSKGPSR